MIIMIIITMMMMMMMMILIPNVILGIENSDKTIADEEKGTPPQPDTDILIIIIILNVTDELA